jgi:hypothetical protein
MPDVDVGEVPPPNLIETAKHGPVPDVVYRFFTERAHAEALLDGRVWMSTIEACRRAEGAARGDPDEGTTYYTSGAYALPSADPRMQYVAKRSGIYVDPESEGMKLIGNRAVWRRPDAWILCTTERYDPAAMDGIGGYAVAIASPLVFLYHITKALMAERRLRYGRCGPVTYASRHYADLEQEQAHPGFLKPPDQYSQQREYRFLWPAADPREVLTPFELKERVPSRLMRAMWDQR